MYDFLLQLFLIGSLSVIVYLMARALPRVANGEKPRTVYDYVDVWLTRIPVHKVDDRLNQYVFKVLRRLRVLVMRADNFLVQKLNNSKRNNSNGNGVKDLLDELKNGR